jgi:type II secretory pathway pseudopilin PulG
MRLGFSLFFLAILPLHGQDVLVQQQQVVQQQTEQQVQIQNQLTAQQNQRILIDSLNQTPTSRVLPKPNFSVKPGTYPGTLSVRIEDRRLPQAGIYYTTDGWTPTPLSTHYTGPITITETTRLQAIAVLGAAQSRITSASYIVPAAVATSSPIATASTLARIVFTAPLSSKGAQIGDAVPVALAEDLKVDGLTVPKGTPVNATVTHVSFPQWGGLPAAISFTVHSVAFGSKKIVLVGAETLVGTSSADVPFHHGHNVTIPTGATLTARILPVNPGMASK